MLRVHLRGGGPFTSLLSICLPSACQTVTVDLGYSLLKHGEELCPIHTYCYLLDCFELECLFALVIQTVERSLSVAVVFSLLQYKCSLP